MFEVPKWLRNCEGVSRRALLQVGSVSMFGLTLNRALQAKAESSGRALPARDINCILLWTYGGMSNIDTLDMKPDAPAEYRGEFHPIDSSVPGAPVCEHLPLMAKLMHKVCQIRTIMHVGSQHAEASHFMLTGYPQIPDVNAAPVGSLVYPAFGSVVAREKGWRNGLPPNVQLAGGTIQYSGGGYLGSAWNPLMVRADPNAASFSVRDVTIPGSIGAERTARRQSMLARLDAWQKSAEQAGAVSDRNAFYRQAFDLITSRAAKEAFRIEDEPPHLRDKYGRSREGQATLLARRLIESGVRFVTVEFGGWDTHDKNFLRLKDPLLPTLDRAWSALIEDLDARGLLDTTLVICAGEFGRTPRVNGAAGRDHYPFTNVVGFSGADVRMGEIVGRTDRKCEYPVGQQNSTLDYAATIFRILGVDDTREYHTEDGRPVLINGGGKPILGVMG